MGNRSAGERLFLNRPDGARRPLVFLGQSREDCPAPWHVQHLLFSFSTSGSGNLSSASVPRGPLSTPGRLAPLPPPPPPRRLFVQTCGPATLLPSRLLGCGRPIHHAVSMFDSSGPCTGTTVDACGKAVSLKLSNNQQLILQARFYDTRFAVIRDYREATVD